MCVHSQGGPEHFSEVKEINPAKQKLKVELLSRAPGHMEGSRHWAPSFRLKESFMPGLKGCETGQEHISPPLISALISMQHFLSSGGELSLGRLSSSQELKGQETKRRS